jgi:hypothetical protein
LSGASGVSADFDAEKVERISNAIEKGEYTINAEAIADKLIANAAEVLNNTHQDLTVHPSAAYAMNLSPSQNPLPAIPGTTAEIADPFPSRH